MIAEGHALGGSSSSETGSTHAVSAGSVAAYFEGESMTEHILATGSGLVILGIVSCAHAERTYCASGRHRSSSGHCDCYTRVRSGVCPGCHPTPQ
jgi:hypothetical protein